MNGISNYKGDYTGPMSERPQAIRPRSAHRDNATDARFSGTTTVNQSFRQFSDEERKSARMRYVSINFKVVNITMSPTSLCHQHHCRINKQFIHFQI